MLTTAQGCSGQESIGGLECSGRPPREEGLCRVWQKEDWGSAGPRKPQVSEKVAAVQEPGRLSLICPPPQHKPLTAAGL